MLTPRLPCPPALDPPDLTCYRHLDLFAKRSLSRDPRPRPVCRTLRGGPCVSSITCQIFRTKGFTTVPEVRIAAEPRTEFGKGAARRTRRQGRVPAIIYGHGMDTRHITLPGHDGTRRAPQRTAAA